LEVTCLQGKRRQGNKFNCPQRIKFSARSKQLKFYPHFLAGHVFEAAVWLHPIPLPAEDFGDLSAAFIPVLVDSGLDRLKVGIGEGLFLMVIGNIIILYQNRIADARKKCMRLKKIIGGIWLKI